MSSNNRDKNIDNDSSATNIIDSLIQPKKYERCEICIVFISRNYLAQEIEMIPKYIYSRLQPKFLTGCVVDKVYDNKMNVGNGISLFLSGRREDGNHGNYRIDGFSINTEGPRKIKAKSVGRWKNVEEIRNDQISPKEWYDITKFQSISRMSSDIFDLPEKLKELKGENIRYINCIN